MLEINPCAKMLPESAIQRVKRLSTTLLADAMAGAGAMDYRIKPITPGTRLIGTALTVNLRPGDNMALHKAIVFSKGYVLVADHKMETTSAPWGDLMTRAAMAAGAIGTVVGGVVRDINDLRQLSFPIFAMGTVPNATSKSGPGEINVPISCGGVAVQPGDLIVGDDDGVVVIKPEMLEQVLAAAENKAQQEQKRIKEIEAGIIEPEWLRQK
ncbi:MAG: RraA family protein [Negativicutes bacterium]|nr:RraA family protein [Negativicutes bacterium]